MKNSSVIEVFDQQSGEVKPYKLMSARLPDFLKEYPKSEGYQVKVSTSDMLHSKPGLIRLYEAAMTANMAPNQAGLPPLPDANIVIFTASLIDKEGRVLDSASATRHLTGYPKEWEKGETAARQRLLAALGFGGDCFDEDETADIAALDTRPKTSAKTAESKSKSTLEKAAPATESAGESSATDKSSVADESQSTEADAPAQDEGDKPAQAKAPAKKSRKRQESSDDGEDGVIPAHILRQIEHQAKLKGAEVPSPKNVKEAKEELKKLMRL